MNSTIFFNRLKVSALLLTLLLSRSLVAANEKKVNAKVERAIVFLQGAQLFSDADFTINPGTSDLIFEGVSPFINAATLQAAGNGNFIIMDVRHNVKYPELLPYSDKPKPKNLKLIKAMEDSITEIGWQLDDLNERRSALTLEKNALLNNRIIKGETKRDSLAILKDALEYLRTRLANLNAEFSKIKRDEFRANQTKDRITLRLNELYEENRLLGEVNPEQKQGVVNQVIVTVSALAATTGNISINYFVSNAGWTPAYDIRATSSNSNLKLDLKANVYQNSGIDWKDALLTLSTGTPGQGNTKPELATNYLTYYLPRTYSYQAGSTAPAVRAEKYVLSDKTENAQADYEALTSANYTMTVENPIRVDYEVKLKYSIPSDSKNHMVLVQSNQLDANFIHTAVPKLDANAFLMAEISKWEDLNLIPGPARIYFDGAYVGETSLNTQEAGDTLQLNMGRDKTIIADRKKVKDKSKEKVFNNDKVVKFTYEITLRNTKSSAVKVKVEDQIPLSNIEEIKILLLESGQAVHNAEDGSLTWTINLKAKEVKKLTFSYEVTYPKNKYLAGL